MKNYFSWTACFLFSSFPAKEILIQHFFRLCSIVSRETICIRFANKLYATRDYRMNVCDAKLVTFAKRSG